MEKHYNTVIIGGGFYGLSVALFLRDTLNIDNILVIEKEQALMTRASYVNQARVHNGYHYPRSILTAYRSAVNFPRFINDYADAVVNDFDKYYAISKSLSKVNARQFLEFCHKVGIDIETAPKAISDLFTPRLTEGVFKVKEYAFDSRKLRNILLERVNRKPGITIQTGENVDRITKDKAGIKIITNNDAYTADYVINCSYSQINTLHRRSGLELVPLKHEIAEMCLVKLPEHLKDFSVTIMDGPFFSIMPFPSRGLHTLSHVRYTPHESWLDSDDTPEHRHDTHDYFAKLDRPTNYKKMYADVVRYIPALKDMELADTIRDVKTVLRKSEDSDSRPILFNAHFGIRNYTCIMGGKLDNIYDVFEDLEGLYGKT